ncbi:hypothetical protein [Nostoc sp. LEGE 12450]|uniref:hypothetical protein n=1 Tax=Nostoc sp. LEGE 12450 TaxID=1828643 RepID=UPI001D143AFE|nr:hypothetical protein [Nostoc sp. LEGE 12450]
MTTEDKWISSDPRTGKLVIRFRVRGFSNKQFYLNTGLQASKTNWDIVRSRKEIIERDIALNRFDPTLELYKFGNYQNAVVPVEKASLDKDMA